MRGESKEAMGWTHNDEHRETGYGMLVDSNEATLNGATLAYKITVMSLRSFGAYQ